MIHLSTDIAQQGYSSDSETRERQRDPQEIITYDILEEVDGSSRLFHENDWTGIFLVLCSCFTTSNRSEEYGEGI